MNFFERFKSPIRKLPFEQRREIIQDISETASAGFDFYLLVVLSGSIATLGLITNSPAVIIGAMLVAPLMSPIIGIGLASMIGRDALLKTSLSGLVRGALLAIVLSALITLINSYLPFVSLQEIPIEIISRTHPSPIDLVVALAGGFAAAYALTEVKLSAALPGVAIATALMPPLCTVGVGLALQRWDIAGGAVLLFITNTITIAFASALVFFLRGFNPIPVDGNRKLPPSLQLSAILIVVLLVPLTYFSVQFVQKASQNRELSAVISQEVNKLQNAELVDIQSANENGTLNVVLTLRTSNPLKYEQVVALQEAIVQGLNQPISLRVNQVFAERLDPLIPPTATATATATRTATAGPSPTQTFTATATATLTATSTATQMPSATPSSTPSPAQAKVFSTGLPPMRLYQSPGGPIIGTLLQKQELTVLPHEVLFQNLLWVEVIDAEGRQGWVPRIYVVLLTATPSPTWTNTATLATP